MSSEETDEDLPPADECQRLCESFAEITGTDTACAQYYLQDRKWILDRSINDFFEDIAKPGALPDNESEVVVVLDCTSRGLAATTKAVLTESSSSIHLKETTVGVEETKPDNKSNSYREPYRELKFVTWNIDGLNEKNLKLRTEAVYKRILNEQADVVFLQEVVPESAAYFLKHLLDYECVFGNEVGYFVGTLLKKTTVRFEDFHIIDFPTTRMMRNVLSVNARLGSVPLSLLNTHLESTAESAEERKRQLRTVLQDVVSVPDERTVILAGDLNSRDKELNEIGGLPAGIEDVWVMCGSRKECTYTWDMTRNDNTLFNGRFKPRCRFDRVYLRGSSPGKLMPKFFGLIGLERLTPHRCFPSDHWGILCHFEMIGN